MTNLAIIELAESVGVGEARNIGIAAATAEYVWNCDCDDAWDPEILAKLVAAAQTSNSDVAVCAAWSRPEGSLHTRLSPGLSMKRIVGRVVNGSEGLAWLLWGDLSGNVWNKLIRRHLLGATTFSELRTHQDLYSMLDIVSSAPRITAIGDPLYTYVQRSTSNLNLHVASFQTLISVRDHAREVVDRYGQQRYQLALEHFEAKTIAIPILQLAARTQKPDAELVDAVTWARSAIRGVKVTVFIRRREYLAAAFAGLSRIRSTKTPYLIFRVMRRARASVARTIHLLRQFPGW